MTQLAGVNVLVTGASSGFGKLICEELVRGGYLVFASMREIHGDNAEAAHRLRSWSEGQDGRVEVVEMDVTDEDSVDRCVDSLLAAEGHIDVVVNNAGVASLGLLEAFTVEQARALFDVNTFGPLRVNRAVLPHMRRRRSGLLVHITGVTGRLVCPFMGLYSATKFALEAIAESYRFELGAYGIDSVIVEPGAYPTELYSKMGAPADAGRLVSYGEMSEKANRIFENLSEGFSSPTAPDPREVARAVRTLIETPPSMRKLRTVVGLMGTEGVVGLNLHAERAQGMLAESLHMSIGHAVAISR